MMEQFEKFTLGETDRFIVYQYIKKNKISNLHDFYPIYSQKNVLNSIMVTSLEFPLKNQTQPVYKLNLPSFGNNFEFHDNYNQFSEGFFHARNYLQDYFTNDKYLDFIVFDHGYDVPPFPGAKSKFFSYQDGLYQENTSFFEGENSFVFSGCSGDWDNDGRPELLIFDLMYYTGFHFYERQNDKLVKNQERMADVKNGLGFYPLSGTCFKGADGINKLAIGAVGDRVSARADLILTPDKRGNFNLDYIEPLPTRRGGEDWACVSIEPIRFLDEKKDSLIALYHDAPVQNGIIDIYTQNDAGVFSYFNESAPISEEKNSWYYRYRQMNLSIAHQNPDSIIVLKSRGLKKFVARDYNFLILNKVGNNFIDVSYYLQPLIGKEFSGVMTIRNHKSQLDDIVFFDNHGNYYYCLNKH